MCRVAQTTCFCESVFCGESLSVQFVCAFVKEREWNRKKSMSLLYIIIIYLFCNKLKPKMEIIYLLA